MKAVFLCWLAIGVWAFIRNCINYQAMRQDPNHPERERFEAAWGPVSGRVPVTAFIVGLLLAIILGPMPLFSELGIRLARWMRD